MNLVIDIGNTLQKVAVFDRDGKLSHHLVVEKVEVMLLEKILAKFPIQRSIVSSVAESAEDVQAYLQLHTSFLPFSANVSLPIKLLYESPQTLGLDRIANAVGAAALFPNENLLALQAGTCLVADFVDCDGNFRGGTISPGLTMRFRALHEFTQRLPLESRGEIDTIMGNTTKSSIQVGVIQGFVYEIEGIINAFSRQYPHLKVLLTGGDLSYLQKSIKNMIFAAPNLVLWGLNKILDFNGKEM